MSGSFFRELSFAPVSLWHFCKACQRRGLGDRRAEGSGGVLWEKGLALESLVQGYRPAGSPLDLG